jgi:hypothetical protein
LKKIGIEGILVGLLMGLSNVSAVAIVIVIKPVWIRLGVDFETSLGWV